MSLDKAIRHGKDRRKPFRGSALFDGSCRHGGSCDWCRGNRTIQAKRLLQESKQPQRTENP